MTSWFGLNEVWYDVRMETSTPHRTAKRLIGRFRKSVLCAKASQRELQDANRAMVECGLANDKSFTVFMKSVQEALETTKKASNQTQALKTFLDIYEKSLGVEVRETSCD